MYNRRPLAHLSPALTRAQPRSLSCSPALAHSPSPFWPSSRFRFRPLAPPVLPALGLPAALRALGSHVRCDRHMRIGTCEMPLRSRLCALVGDSVSRAACSFLHVRCCCCHRTAVNAGAGVGASVRAVLTAGRLAESGGAGGGGGASGESGGAGDGPDGERHQAVVAEARRHLAGGGGKRGWLA